MKRWTSVALGALLALGVAACGSDDEAQPVASTAVPDLGTTTEDPPPGTLPPAGALELEPIYGEALGELGLRLTDRGGLIDRSGGGYVASAEGDHLALYVEPIGERTTAEFVAGIRDVAVVFGDVFDRWPGLETYDVCQEPAGDDPADGSEPLPVTQIEPTRAESDAIDWSTVTAADLVQASLADPPRVTLRVSPELATDPLYTALVG